MKTDAKRKAKLNKNIKKSIYLEDSLLASFFETVVTDSNDAVIIYDLYGKIQLWNRGAERMYGYCEKEALSMNIMDIAPEDKREEDVLLINKVIAGEKIKSFKTQRITKSGAILDIWLTVSRLKDNNGNVIAIATTARDITEYNRILLALRRATRQIVSAQEKERHRIARDIHDDLGQALIAFKMYFIGILPELSKDRPETKKLYDEMAQQLNEIIEKTRNLSHELFPPSLKHLGLIGALKDLVDQFSNNSLKIKFSHQNLKEVDFENKDIIIYRIFQEALSNIIKHAKANIVDISIIYKSNKIFIDVRDNGIGFDSKKLNKKGKGFGLGLSLMEERVLLMEGLFKLESIPKKGTNIQIEIPVKKVGET